MALWIPPRGEMRDVFPKNIVEGFTLEELYELIGCDVIDIVGIADGQKMVVDDEGHLKRLPPNLRATAFYQQGRGTGWAIVGNVVLCLPAELK
jgi:Domain of unknown function (DUF3846)